MTAAAIHLALLIAAVAFLAAIGILLVSWHGRSRHIDAVVNALLPEADARLLEHEEQRMRAEHAVRRRDAAERRMRGVR